MAAFVQAAMVGVALLAPGAASPAAHPPEASVADAHVLSLAGRPLPSQHMEAHVWTVLDHGAAMWPGAWQRRDSFFWQRIEAIRTAAMEHPKLADYQASGG
jgi:hypothetical protein